MLKFWPFAIVTLGLLGHAVAEVRSEGSFVAGKACPAFQSIRNETNPGSIRTVSGKTYPLVAKNRPDATHYLIEVEGASPLRRWVAIECGVAEESSAGSASPAARSEPSNPGRVLEKAEFVLAVSWQPAFCESSSGRGKTECDTQTDARFDATHFALHGLWPQPRARAYCSVAPDLAAADRNHRWDRLPAPDLTSETRRELERVMPGTMSFLERHEWIKHGTCFGGEPPEAYFARAIALVDQLNASSARTLFAENIGSEITSASIRAAFDRSFGPGSGDRVRVSCQRDGRRNLIAEVTIGLAGPIGEAPSLARLIAASPPTDPGCPRGLVDPAGRQ
jgi:ribonuclease T2